MSDPKPLQPKKFLHDFLVRAEVAGPEIATAEASAVLEKALGGKQ